MRCPGNNCLEFKLKQVLVNFVYMRIAAPTVGVFGSILSGEEFRILLVDLAEYVLRCALAKEPWRAVQGKGKSPSGIIVEYLGG